MLKYDRLVVGPFATNCLLVHPDDCSDCVVIDPGGDVETAADRIRILGCKPTMVLLTHAHLDHCLGASEIAERFGVPIAMHEKDLPLYENLPRQVETLLGPQAAETFGKARVVRPSRLLGDGELVPVGQETLEVLYLPGHTPGGLGFLARQDPPVLFCGDTIFKDGIGRTDLWGGDFATLMRSIKRRVFALPGETVLVPGHGAETTVHEESRQPYFQD